MDKGVMWIEEGVLQWFGHVERDRIVKRVYLGECACSCSVGGHGRDRYCEEVFKVIGLDVRQVRRMVQDRIEWWRFVKGNA